MALYAVYIGVQVRYFFLAADANVYQAFGLTYAEYIHKGFYELLTVSGLNILIAKVSWELSREREDRPSMLVRALIGLVLACAVVIACSGISRAWHYITAYGLSVERVLVVYASVLAIAVFLVGFAKLASPRLREMPLAVAVALVSFVALAYTNIEETVASYNIATQPIEKLDSLYILEGLSEDALDEKLWILARDPERVVRTDIDWACDVDIRAAQRDGTPPPVCDPQKEVTNREALGVWLSQARNRANRSNMLRPPL